MFLCLGLCNAQFESVFFGLFLGLKSSFGFDSLDFYCLVQMQSKTSPRENSPMPVLETLVQIG